MQDNPPGMLSEEETKEMMKRMHQGYLARMLNAELDRIREQERLRTGGAHTENGIDGDAMDG